MTAPRPPRPDSSDAARGTAATEIAERLRRRNVRVDALDDGDAMLRMLDAVEGFEREVERLGGDLMVDEPPPGARPQPDRQAFVLPARAIGESADAYAERVLEATERLRR